MATSLSSPTQNLSAVPPHPGSPGGRPGNTMWETQCPMPPSPSHHHFMHVETIPKAGRFMAWVTFPHWVTQVDWILRLWGVSHFYGFFKEQTWKKNGNHQAMMAQNLMFPICSPYFHHNHCHIMEDLPPSLKRSKQAIAPPWGSRRCPAPLWSEAPATWLRAGLFPHSASGHGVPTWGCWLLMGT